MDETQYEGSKEMLSPKDAAMSKIREEAIEKINIYTNIFKNSNEFYNSEDQKSFNATINLLIAIGEESKKIEENIKIKFSETDWKLLAGLRDKISHDYRGIDPDLIWSIVSEDLNVLKSELIIIFKDLNIEKEFLNEIVNSKYYSHIKYLMEI